jgi:hypothetical protein
MITIFNIWWSGAAVAALICLYENYKYTSKISISKIDTALILLSWVTVVFWVWASLPRK